MNVVRPKPLTFARSAAPTTSSPTSVPTRNPHRVSFVLGESLSEREEISVSPELLFGRHLAILGSTGSGKSWTLARIIEESARFDSKVILFDASGEFHTLGEGVMHVQVGCLPGTQPQGEQVSVPYYHLRESDLFAIFKPSSGSQAPKLRQAMKSLKLARHAPQLAPDGTIFKAHRVKTQFEEEYRQNQREIDSPYASFDIHCLATQIQHECVDPQRSALEPLVWGGVNGVDLSCCTQLINRVQDIVGNPAFAPIFRPKGMRSLFEVFREFFVDPSKRVLRVSLRDLPFEHNTREILVNSIGLHLLDLGRNGAFHYSPLVLILDEAHQFLKTNLMNDTENLFPLDAFGIIAKEGRKYSVNLCISTQRPRDIPEDVLSQAGTMIVHRLTNPGDRAIVEKACGDLDAAAAASLPRFQPGEAIVLGAGFVDPVAITVSAPERRPDSRGPDFQQFWSRGTSQ